MGGACVSSSGACTPRAGVVSELPFASVPTTACGVPPSSGWIHERYAGSTELWPARPVDHGTELVDIVRAPQLGLAVALFVYTPQASTGVLPSLRFRVIDEPSSYAFYE